MLGDWLPLALSGAPRTVGRRAACRMRCFSCATEVCHEAGDAASYGWSLSGVLAGCRAADISRPPSLRFGDEACGYCRMIISDERFAAALVTETGEALKFDDVGCLIQNEDQSPETGACIGFATSAATDGSTPATRRFVHSTNVVSPMDYGLAALPTEEAARKLAARPRPIGLCDSPNCQASWAIGRERLHPVDPDYSDVVE